MTPRVSAPAALSGSRSHSRLLHLRPFGRVVLATLVQPDGTLTLIRASTADQPGLEHLSDRDRATVQGAVLALHQLEGARHAA